jgi:hypothetical protein
LDKLEKKIKKEENEIEHEIENKSIENETEIEEISEEDFDILKMKAETLETEMHETAIKFDNPLNDDPEEKKSHRRKQKKGSH